MYSVISRIWRPIKEGFLGMFRHGATVISSMFAVTITLIIISLFIIFSVNIQQFTKGLEEGVLKVAVLVDYDHEAAEQEDALAMHIREIDGVASVSYSGKDEEFQYYIDSFSDEKTKEAFEPFRNSNPMHDAFYVEVKEGSSIEEIANTINEMEGVYKVNYGGSSAVSLVNAMRSIRTGGAIIALALSVLAIFLIQNTIKLTISARADEIAIMRNVGAKNGFIRSPFIVEGALIGALGSIIPILLSYFGYKSVYKATGGYVISSMFTLIKPVPFLKWLVLALLGIGTVVGLVGCSFSVSRYLRWKR